jgi:UDP-N-acetylglucosamine 2-epimerase (non-hydrolysing)
MKDNILTKINIVAVVGTRPNFVKMRSVIRSLDEIGYNVILVHTGQHYDKNMSKSFFEDLELPDPNFFLDVNKGSRGTQIARVIMEFDKVCQELNPAMVIVAGDVNSTLACALSAYTNGIKVAHVESGLRSFDLEMPEEMNRILTDKLSNLLFVTEKSGLSNLENEGFDMKNTHFVGNSMIDSLKVYLKKAIDSKPWENYGIEKGNYCLVTLHRPSNVDDKEKILQIIDLINEISKKVRLIFPVHPRTHVLLKKFKLNISKNIKLINSLSYIEFLGLMSGAKVILTDSGGIQEESSFLGIQCITYRNNTERPITIENGTNHLVGDNNESVLKVLDKILRGEPKIGTELEKWDGRAGERIAKIISEYLQ